MSRKTSYRPEYVRQARLLCEEFGATNEQLAKLLNCSRSTLDLWMDEHPEFSGAIKEGKAAYDDKNVQSSLLACALGYVMKEYKWHPVQGNFVPVPVFHPPQYKAIISWLHNRQGWLWPSQRPELPPPELPAGTQELMDDHQFQDLARELLERRYHTRIKVDSHSADHR